MQDPGYVRSAFARVAGRYVVTNHVLSGGIDVLWRRKVAHLVRRRGPRRLLDVATGTGDLAAAVQKALPDADVHAVDFCLPMLRKARERGVPGLAAADGLRLPFADGAFDAVTIGYGLRNMESYPGAAREFARVIRPGGFLLVLDFSTPGGLLRPLYGFYLHQVLPRVAGLITGQRAAYEYLAGSIEAFPSGQAMVDLLAAHGFKSATHQPLSGGISSIYVAER